MHDNDLEGHLGANHRFSTFYVSDSIKDRIANAENISQFEKYEIYALEVSKISCETFSPRL